MKKYFSLLLRGVGLGGVADSLRFQLAKLVNRKKNKNFQLSHANFSFPPDYYIYETYTLNYQDYFEDGLEIAKNIRAAAAPFLDFNNGSKAILDWGCGPGRVIRHLPTVLGSAHNYFGSDYNIKYVDWCNNNLKEISFFKNELLPPMKPIENTFDLIYGFSILTHLSKDAHFEWMKEFMRLLKPGGLLLLTTQGDACIFKLTSSENEKYQAGKFVERHFATEGHRMYSAFHPKAFIEKLAGDFQVVKFIAGKPNGDFGIQDGWLFQKPVS